MAGKLVLVKFVPEASGRNFCQKTTVGFYQRAAGRQASGMKRTTNRHPFQYSETTS